MPKIAYINKRFNSSSEFLIYHANKIIDEYTADGFSLTLRQLYYQFVARDLIENSQVAYKRLGSVINDARLAGRIDWLSIEDRTRNLRGNSHWRNPGEIIESAAYSFRLDKWANQDFRVEVWVEKEALVGVVGRICQELDIDYFACKGYVSASEMWVAANRFRRYDQSNQNGILLHLGDHDPSGIDMTRDMMDRLNLFDGRMALDRIALNMDQIEQYDPPPNPAKTTDARFREYYNKFGQESWELDALDPKVIRDLISKRVMIYRDPEKYQQVLDQEHEYKTILKNVSENWRTL